MITAIRSGPAGPRVPHRDPVFFPSASPTSNPSPRDRDAGRPLRPRKTTRTGAAMTGRSVGRCGVQPHRDVSSLAPPPPAGPPSLHRLVRHQHGTRGIVARRGEAGEHRVLPSRHPRCYTRVPRSTHAVPWIYFLRSTSDTSATSEA